VWRFGHDPLTIKDPEKSLNARSPISSNEETPVKLMVESSVVPAFLKAKSSIRDKRGDIPMNSIVCLLSMLDLVATWWKAE
jgi:hypothetical protein